MTQKTVQRIVADEAGFSLMEMMVGIFLLSVVSVMTTMIMSGYFKGDDILDKTISRMKTISKARRTISDDLMHHVAHPLSIAGKKGTNAKDKLVLRFMRTAAMEAAIDDTISTLQTVEYRLRDRKLVRRAYVRPNPTAATPYHDYILLSDVDTLKLKYLIDSRWVDEWSYTGTDVKPRAPDPAAIEFQWTFASDRKTIPEKSYSSLFRFGGRL